jgi:hypothetical protein
LNYNLSEHIERCREASHAYTLGLEPDLESPAWYEEVKAATAEVRSVLVDTRNLTDIAAALEQSGGIVSVLRFLIAPPLSQDQFKLAFPSWPKSSEKSGRPLAQKIAVSLATDLNRWYDESLVRLARSDVNADRETAIAAVSYMIAYTRFKTNRRMRLAQAQEQAVLRDLVELGFTQIPKQRVDRPGMVAERHFMHATYFATADGSAHEVDVAIGLPRGRVLALECKVSNDATNSVKRVNDVLKKATAWKAQWGQMVLTGALLQGVFSEKELPRLIAGGVHLFWSHRLEDFKIWLEVQAKN